MKILVIGAGWIGSQLVDLLKDHNPIISKIRIDQYGSIAPELDKIQPTHVLLTAGLTGNPNVCNLESRKQETFRVNIIATSVLIDECYKRGIHVTFVSSGCIYSYDEKHPIGGPGFTELDEPNFTGSVYSQSKILVEKIVKEFPNVLVLRIRMPLSDDLHPKNFITKITRYEKVINIPNSMSVLADLLPLLPNMMIRKLTGVFNFTNPGVISHNRILDLYREHIDPNFKYTNFSLEEHDKILKAKRSNNCLDVTKLVKEYPQIPPIDVAIVDLFKRMKAKRS